MAAEIKSNNEVAVVDRLSHAIGSVYGKIAPEELNWQSEKQFLLAQIQAQPVLKRAVESDQTELTEATIESVKVAARECAAMGLSMSVRARLVYFIPRRARRRADGEKQADYERTVPWIVYAEPSYMGLAFIMTHYCGGTDVASEVVYKADHFVYRGPMEKPEHAPTLDNDQRNEKLAIGAYAMIRMASGTWRCEYIDAPTIQKIRGMSDRPDSVMWTKLWTEGWRKAAVRRLAKLTVTANIRMQAAEGAMQETQGYTFDGEGQVVEVPRGTPPSEEPEAPRSRPKGLSAVDAQLEKARASSQEPEVKTEAPPVVAETGLKDPAPSEQPIGAIEWWCEQIAAATTRERLDDIRAAALADRVDAGPDADTFRAAFSARAKELKAPKTKVAPTEQGALV